MPIKSLVIFFFAMTFLGTGCNARVVEEAATTDTPSPTARTLPVTKLPLASETQIPPPQPTTAPVDGVTSTQVNVRAEPSTAGSVLGMIPADTRVEITGKDPGENWWQINYPAGVDGKGWVTAQYVVTANKDLIPTIGGEQADPARGNMAVIQQQLNVRSGPGTGFNSLGTLNAQDVVSLVGKDPNGAWLQIEFPAGPEGKGWLNAAFVRAQGVENLPIVTEAGLVVGTGTPTQIPATPTVTVVPAWDDSDSAGSPLASVMFDPAGTQTLIYNGDLSSPEGDRQDWVAFIPYGSAVFIEVQCQGNGSIEIEMTENTQPVETAIECGAPIRRITVKPGSKYLVDLQAMPSNDVLQYAKYTLTIKMRP